MQVYALVEEATLRDTLRDRRLSTLEARSRLAIASTRLLTLVTTTRGLTQTRAATTTQSLLLHNVLRMSTASKLDNVVTLPWTWSQWQDAN